LGRRSEATRFVNQKLHANGPVSRHARPAEWSHLRVLEHLFCEITARGRDCAERGQRSLSDSRSEASPRRNRRMARADSAPDAYPPRFRVSRRTGTREECALRRGFTGASCRPRAHAQCPPCARRGKSKSSLPLLRPAPSLVPSPSSPTFAAPPCARSTRPRGRTPRFLRVIRSRPSVERSWWVHRPLIDAEAAPLTHISPTLRLAPPETPAWSRAPSHALLNPSSLPRRSATAAMSSWSRPRPLLRTSS
jgi:hypothetical protein